MVTWYFLPCFPGIVRVPDEDDGEGDVLYDSSEVMGINQLPELLEKLTEGEMLFSILMACIH